MREHNKLRNLLIISLLGCFLGGCKATFWRPFQTSPARVGERTETVALLDSLPEPKDQLIAAVYQFRDQTGQYKPTEGGSSFSTAVTQGGTNILLRVLQDSKWFVPIERENIGNLLNERKIIRSTRTQYGITDELPALLFAGVILEGGIVSYDANMVTGGAGLRYFGTGGSSQYREDRVTVYLRAISVSNGKILKTVYSSKRILSQSLDGGIFKYVKFKRLLEAETGITYNEPSELAVTEAIEVAVRTLILEGMKDNLWDAKNAGDRKKYVDFYEKEKAETPTEDPFGQTLANRRRKMSLEIGGAGQLIRGDYALPKPGYGGQIGLFFTKKPAVSVGFSVGQASIRTLSGFNSRTNWADLRFQYRPMPFNRFTPIYEIGLGAINSKKSSVSVLPQAHAGLGFEVFPTKKSWSFFALADANYLPSDKLDGLEIGRFTDWFWHGSAGVRFYFGKKISGSKSLSTAGEKPKTKAPLSEF
jgi:curli production assembly/transport component CsgG